MTPIEFLADRHRSTQFFAEVVFVEVLSVVCITSQKSNFLEDDRRIAASKT
jgi:hypothetical protein